jgi:DNA-binding Lrp family transcriptional regulator
MKLSAHDKKILYALSNNCRYPISTVAKIAGLHRETAAGRIAKMEQEGIIEKYICTTFQSAIGFFRYSELFYTGNYQSDQISELVKIPEVTHITAFDHALWLTLKISHVAKAKEVIKNIQNILGGTNTVENYQISRSNSIHKAFYLDVDPEPITISAQGCFSKELNEYGRGKVFPRGFVALSDVELDILQNLRVNARLPVGELSTIIEKDRSTVETKIKGLIKKGLIQQFTIHINHNKLGFHKFFVFMNGDSKKILDNLRFNKNAAVYYEFVSRWDLGVVFICKDYKLIRDSIEDLQAKGLINEYKLLSGIKEYKMEPYPPNMKEIHLEMKTVLSQKKI